MGHLLSDPEHASDAWRGEAVYAMRVGVSGLDRARRQFILDIDHGAERIDSALVFDDVRDLGMSIDGADAMAIDSSLRRHSEDLSCDVFLWQTRLLTPSGGAVSFGARSIALVPRQLPSSG